MLYGFHEKKKKNKKEKLAIAASTRQVPDESADLKARQLFSFDLAKPNPRCAFQLLSMLP